ncbi:toxin C-terminal domain-containing protein [Microbulbifer sp. 2304DJ12-6]|uniref:toxin C-terminal domain-containing protein n=1 Tax=Microbulbifer sp. 2304DJ12-6 TaxID=3233340 RepID=UPI0039AF915C
MKRVIVFFVLALVTSFANAITFNGVQYDVYLGDLNGDQVDDIYLHALDEVIIIHGDVAVPIVLPTTNDSYIFYSNGLSYDDGVVSNNVDPDSLTRVQRGIAQFDFDEDGIVDLSIDQQNAMSYGLVIAGSSSGVVPTVLSVDAPITHIGNVSMVAVDPSNDVMAGPEYKGRLIAEPAITKAGTFNYRIPIEVPPGINDMQPQLALTYSSSAVNGLLGWGWNLSGLSRITRCRATPFHDDDLASVNWGDGYKYCLDGRRLVETNSGVYQTEVESFSRIERTGSAVAPTSWTVYHKDGKVDRFGLEINSRIRDSANKNLAWLISSKTDVAGNYLTYSYTGSDHRISLIEYTMNDGSGARDANHDVSFVYESRFDPISTSTAGVMRISDQRLSRIEVKTNTALVRNYQLTYQVPGSTHYGKTISADLKASRLSSIRLCFDTLFNCAAPTEIDWGDLTATYAATTHQIIEDTDLLDRGHSTISADLNKDGFADLLWVFTTGPSVGYKSALGNGDGTFTLVTPPDSFINVRGSYPDAAASIAGDAHDWQNMVYDHNGDGNLDLLFTYEYKNDFMIYTVLGRGDGTFDYPLAGGGSTPIVGGVSFSRDLTFSSFICQCNEDTNQDVVFIRTNAGTGYAPAGIEVYTLLSNGDGTFQPQIGGMISTNPTLRGPAHTGDFNGDGIDDFLLWAMEGEGGVINSEPRENITFQVALGTGSGTFTIQEKQWFSAPTNHVTFSAKPMVVDLNLDGHDDIVSSILWSSNHQTRVERRYYSHLGNGDGTFTAPKLLANHGLPLDRGYSKLKLHSEIGFSEGIITADFNGDGYPDLVNYEYHQDKIYVAYGSANNTFTKFTALPGTYFGYEGGLHDVRFRRFTADLNGDGYIDLGTAYMGDDGLGVFVSTSTLSSNHNRVTEIRDTLGNYVNVEYSNLSDQSTYLGHETSSNTEVIETASAIETTSRYSNYGGSDYIVSIASSQYPVVKTVKMSDGIGGERSKTFTYKGSLYHRRGLGHLGFSQVEELTVKPNLGGFNQQMKSLTMYHQVVDAQGRYYLAGRVKRKINKAGAAGLEDSFLTVLSDERYRWKVREYSDDIDAGSFNSPHFFPYVIYGSTAQNDISKIHLADTRTENSKQASLSCSAVPLSELDSANDIIEVAAGSAGDSDVSDSGVVFYTRTTTCDTSGSSQDVTAHAMEKLEVIDAGNVRGLPQTVRRHRWAGVSTVSTTSATRSTDYTYYLTTGADGYAGMQKSDTVEPGGDQAVEITTTYKYDVYGLKRDVTEQWNDFSNDGVDFTSRTTTITNSYASNGERTTTTQNALGQSSTTVFEAKFGLPRRETDINGLVSKASYDEQGRIETSVDPVGNTTRYWYRVCSNCFSQQSQARWFQQSKTRGMAAERIYFDQKDRRVGTRQRNFDGNNVYTTRSYDLFGRILSQSEPFISGALPPLHQFRYDEADRVRIRTFPDGSSETALYAGHRVTKTNRARQRMEMFLNGPGWIMRSEDDSGTPIVSSYTPFGDLKTVQVNNDASTLVTMLYDAVGRKISLIDPDLGTRSYHYNPLNMLVSETDGKGQRTDYEYDKLERLIQRVDDALGSGSAQRTHSWTYDNASGAGVGLLSRIDGFNTDGSPYTEVLHYDNLARQVEADISIGSASFSTLFLYDDFGRTAGTVYPSSFTVATRYNDFGFTRQLQNATTKKVMWTGNTSNARNQMTRFTFGNGVVTNRHYDANTGLIDTIVAARSGYTVQDHDYDFSPIGNLTRRVDYKHDVTQSFCYDNLNRLKAARFGTCTSSHADFTYDALGNILTKQGVAGNYGYGSGSAGPHAVTSIGDTTYAYDYNGSLIRVEGGGQAKAVTYTAFDKPERITNGANSTTVVYGPHKSRVSRSDSDGTAITYVGDHYEVINKNGHIQEVHHVGNDVRYVLHSGTQVGAEYQYVHRDHLDSVVAVTGDSVSSDADVEFTSFDPWGARVETTWAGLDVQITFEPTNTARGFTGHEHLDSVGLVHMNGRVYDPLIGRFLSADPFVQEPNNTQSYNRYTYVFNNPLSFVDPSGFMSDHLIEEVTVTGQNIEKFFNELKLDTSLYVNNALDQTAMFLIQNQSAIESAIDTTTTVLDVIDVTTTTVSVTATVVTGGSGAPAAVTVKVMQKGVTFAVKFRLKQAKDSLKSLVKMAKTRLKERLSKKEPKPDAAKGVGKVCCFVAGTQVLTKDGYKNIEDVELGELLYSKNVDTGEQDYKPVTQLFKKHRLIYELTVVNSIGESKLIETTDDHPFYVPGKGFVDTIDLISGDMVETEGNGLVVVESVVNSGRYDVTYNFEVADFHTYYATKFNLLVHNCNAIYKTTKEAKQAAENLGFKKINETIHDGQAVFKKGKRFITRDVDGHNGGAWKMAKSVKGLGSKETRLGTFDKDLNRIGD